MIADFTLIRKVTMKKLSLKRMTSAALLVALGIIIPTFSPLKIVIEPASFTLASHVPIFMAMFISPATALAVAIGTTVGFFMGGFPIVVVLRAASHILFVTLGSYYLKKSPQITVSPARLRVFSFAIGVIHAAGEVAVSSLFYFGNRMTSGYYQNGFVYSILLLVGVGTVIHSMIDFEISWLLTKAICKDSNVAALFSGIKIPNE